MLYYIVDEDGLLLKNTSFETFEAAWAYLLALDNDLIDIRQLGILKK